MNRRGLILASLVAAPSIIRIPGLLMPVKALPLAPQEWVLSYYTKLSGGRWVHHIQTVNLRRDPRDKLADAPPDEPESDA